MGRIDAAVEESSRGSAVPSDELADLAATIERIEALIVEGAAQGPDGSAAVERIADIAFALHEREVESSLGNELSTAVREINNVGPLKQVSAERTQQAADLLRQLSGRVHDMIAQSKTDQRSVPAAKKSRLVVAEEDDDEEDDISSNGSFKTDVPEDDEFALVVAALTAALPSLAEFGAPVPVPPSALAQDAAVLIDGAPLSELLIETGDEAKTAQSELALPSAETSGETVMVIESSSTVLLDDAVLPPTPSNKEETLIEDSPAGEPQVGALTDTLLDDLLRDAVRSKNPTDDPPAEAFTEPPREPEPPPEAPSEESEPKTLLALPPPEAVEPAQEAGIARDGETQSLGETEEREAGDVVVPVAAESPPPLSKDASSLSLLPLLAPDDDPGDLFDVTPPAPSNVAAKPEPIVAPSERAPEPVLAVEPPLAESIPFDLEPLTPASSLPKPRVAAAAPAQPVPRPVSNDPLGPIRALSEEETIALFS